MTMMSEREIESSEKSNASHASSSSLDSTTSNECKTPLDLIASPSFPSSSSNYCSNFTASNLLSHTQQQQSSQQQQQQQQQSQVHLQQSQSPSTTFESHSHLNSSSGNSSSKKRKSECDKCKNHLIGTLIKDHKKLCPYKNCKCDRCKFTIVRRRVTSANQRKRRQKEPTKDIFDNVHMSRRLSLLDILTDDLDCVIKNPLSYRVEDTIIAQVYDILSRANLEAKMRPMSKQQQQPSQQTTLPSSGSTDTVSTSLKLSSSNNCGNHSTSNSSGNNMSACGDEGNSTFIHSKTHSNKSSSENVVCKSMGEVFVSSLIREQETHSPITSMVDGTVRKKVRSSESKRKLSTCSSSLMDYTQASVKDHSPGVKKSKKESSRMHEMPSRIDVTSMSTSLVPRSTSVTSGHSPSPAASPISVGSEGTSPPEGYLLTATREHGTSVNEQSSVNSSSSSIRRSNGQCNGRKSDSGPSSDSGSVGTCGSVKVSPHHTSTVVSPSTSPPSLSYLRDAHVNMNDRSSLPQPLVQAAAAAAAAAAASSPFVSPHGPFYPYLYTNHPHRFSSYPLVPQASNAFRFASSASAIFTPAGINAAQQQQQQQQQQSHNIEPSTSFILQQYHRHLQQLASQIHQAPASNACRISRMDS